MATSRAFAGTLKHNKAKTVAAPITLVIVRIAPSKMSLVTLHLVQNCWLLIKVTTDKNSELSL